MRVVSLILIKKNNKLELQMVLEKGTDVTVPLISKILCCFGVIIVLTLKKLSDWYNFRRYSNGISTFKFKNGD